jgi:VanZ like family.
MTRQRETPPSSPGAGTWRMIVFWGAISVTVLAVVIPGDALRWFRYRSSTFNTFMGSIETLALPLNLIHLILFFFLGLAVPIAFARLPGWKLVGWIAGFALLSELIQFLVPGRQPRFEDWLVDIVAASFGVLVILTLRRCVATPAPNQTE